MEKIQKVLKKEDKKVPSTQGAKEDKRAMLKKALRGKGFKEQQRMISPKEDVAKKGIRGSGDSIPYKAEMEEKFQTDLSEVKAHKGKEATQASKSLNAEAYTYGTDIAFKSSTPSKETVAHEVTHVLQQTGVVEKKSSDFSEEKEEAEARKVESMISTGGKIFGEYTMSDSIFSHLPQPEVREKKLRFQLTEEEKKIEEKTQNEIVIGMSKANRREDNWGADIAYPRTPVTLPGGRSETFELGYLDPKYWEPVKQGGKQIPWTFSLKKGQSASEAIDAVFKGPTRLECLSMAKAVYIRSIKEAIGKEKFDRRYGEAGKNNQNLILGAMTSSVDPYLESELIPASEGLKKGDWVYFHNHWKYLTKHPGGAWQGENAIYMGKGPDGLDRFSGFGAHDLTVDTMIDHMVSAYNSGRTSKDEETINEIKENIKKQLKSAGRNESQINEALKIIDEHFADYPDQITAKEVPALDEERAVEKEINKEIADLELRAKLSGVPLSAIEPYKKQLLEQLQEAKKQVKGKISVTRLKTKEVAKLAQ